MVGVKKVSDSLRVAANPGGRGRPMSDFTQRLLDGETLLVPVEINPGNYDRQIKARGMRLRTVLSDNPKQPGRIWWAEEIEPPKPTRKRKSA